MIPRERPVRDDDTATRLFSLNRRAARVHRSRHVKPTTSSSLKRRGSSKARRLAPPTSTAPGKPTDFYISFHPTARQSVNAQAETTYAVCTAIFRRLAATTTPKTTDGNR